LPIGAFRTSPIDSILNYAGEIPLQLQKDQDTLRSIIKRKSTPKYIGHMTIFNNHIAPLINTKYNKSSTILDIFNKLQQSMNIHNSVVNKITLQVILPWKWELKLNIELLDFNKNETKIP